MGHLAREKRARRLRSAAPYTDYLLIHHAAGGHHLSFHAAKSKRDRLNVLPFSRDSGARREEGEPGGRANAETRIGGETK